MMFMRLECFITLRQMRSINNRSAEIKSADRRCGKVKNETLHL